MTNFPWFQGALLPRHPSLASRFRTVARRGAGPLLLLALLAGAAGCRIEQDRQPAGQWNTERSEEVADQARSDLVRTLTRATALADSVEDLLRPVPLMKTADEEALRRFPNDVQVRRARELGARPADTAELRSLLEEGRLLRLEDSTEHWVVRELNASQPYVTPAARSLLKRLGEAFHEKLRERGLPAYRFEISSVLRTPESQAALRQTNPNAAVGTSSHEFGTTVDIVYEAYAAPAALPEGIVADRESPGESAALERVARVVLERTAARKSREIQAILGEVMLAAQSRGEVMVTLERQQPVYHITVARAD